MSWLKKILLFFFFAIAVVFLLLIVFPVEVYREIKERLHVKNQNLKGSEE